jgi:hypothetical protein
MKIFRKCVYVEEFDFYNESSDRQSAEYFSGIRFFIRDLKSFDGVSIVDIDIKIAFTVSNFKLSWIIIQALFNSSKWKIIK